MEQSYVLHIDRKECKKDKFEMYKWTELLSLPVSFCFIGLIYVIIHSGLLILPLL